jgi:cold shock CspA family protein
MQGTVQKYIDLKGYGFISVDFRTRVFFHINDWKSDVVAPEVGMHVTFEISPLSNPAKFTRDKAINVTPVESGVGGAQ